MHRRDPLHTEPFSPQASPDGSIGNGKAIPGTQRCYRVYPAIYRATPLTCTPWRIAQRRSLTRSLLDGCPTYPLHPNGNAEIRAELIAPVTTIALLASARKVRSPTWGAAGVHGVYSQRRETIASPGPPPLRTRQLDGSANEPVVDGSVGIVDNHEVIRASGDAERLPRPHQRHLRNE